MLSNSTVNNLDFYFVSLKKHGHPIIIDPNNKLRYACFQSRESAKNCIEYISDYRSKTGKWPKLDLYRPTVVEYDANVKKRTRDEIKEYLTISRKKFEDIYTAGANTGVSYFYIHKFDYEDDFSKVYMRGQVIDGTPDLVMFRKRLDCRLKIV
tara:strand:+ start:334 stop:792 length:459 start_codon:yes stop_codon:yes gene_type:complete